MNGAATAGLAPRRVRTHAARTESGMEFELIKTTVEDHVATVVMDRPKVNAQNTRFREEIIAAFDSLNDRDDVRVAILTGIGNVFSAGADIAERGSLAAEAGGFWRHNRRTREAPNSIRECFKPVIAAVNGPALGAGFHIAYSCDIILASDNAVFGMPEIDVGLAGGASILHRTFSRSRGRRLFYTGYRMPAAEMYRLGAIECCVPREQLMDEAMKIAREIAGKSPLAIRMAKEAYNVVEAMPEREAYRFEQNMTFALSKTEDSKEAQRAFMEKRKPVFKGR
jgi:enoyl-CoA hydratase